MRLSPWLGSGPAPVLVLVLAFATLLPTSPSPVAASAVVAALASPLLASPLLGPSLLGPSLLGPSLLASPLLDPPLLARPRPTHSLPAPPGSRLGLTHSARPALALPAVRFSTAPTAAPRPGWGWPLAGVPTVTRRFANPPQPWLPGHRGVDLAGSGGAEVRAASAGVVAFAGVVAGKGVVSIDHSGGLRTTYEPVTPLVKAGDPVGLGEVIATLDAGHVGCPGPACLHWGLRRGEVYLDPLLLVRPPRLRLRPL